jgi:hypothetical protein
MPQGLRTTYQSITGENRLVRVPDEDLLMLEPEETALTTFMLGLKKKKVIDSPRIESFEDDYVPQWITSSAAVGANVASVTLTLTDGQYVVPGDLLLVPSGSASNHEMVRVTAKPSINVCTIVRNVGGTGLLTIASGAGVMILGTAYAEGTGAPVSKYTSPASVANFTQIFKRTINITGTDAASKKYADNGDERSRLVTKAGKEFKIQMNNQFIWGKPSEDLTGGPGGEPIRTTGGIDHFIQTNRMDVGGLLTNKQLETFSRMAFRYTSKAILLPSPLIISAINQWASKFQNVSPVTTMFGLNIQKITTGHGQWILVKDWSLRDGVTGQNGFGGYAFSLDMDYIRMRYLAGRDTRILRNRQPNDEDRMTDVIEAEVGLQVRHEKRHARLYGVTDYAA